MSKQCQIDLPAGRVFHGEGRVIPLISDLIRHAPRTPLIAVIHAGNPGLDHNPSQQSHDIVGCEVTADNHHDVHLAPAHEARDEAASNHQYLHASPAYAAISSP